jgi:hypothetical protein
VSSTAQATQTACVAGRYQPAEGSTGCLTADAGNFVDTEGQASQTPCPAGRYQPAAGQTSCLEAQVGYYVNSPGSASETACPAGKTTTGTGSSSESACVPKPLEVETTSLPNATRGQAYSFQLVAAYGTTPYKWKKIGKLPKGLKLSKEGVLSGTPSTKLAAGSYEIVVEVKDSAKKLKHTASRTLMLQIS